MTLDNLNRDGLNLNLSKIMRMFSNLTQSKLDE